MPSLRRAASRLVGALPEHQSMQLRQLVRGVERRLPGYQGPVTYVVSPHPDDETLRLAGFVTWLRHRHPERQVVLVAIGDGGGSSRARKMGWSPEYEREYRRSEQAAAWSALTGGAGEIVRVGLWDNTFTPEQVRYALAPLNKRGAVLCGGARGGLSRRSSGGRRRRAAIEARESVAVAGPAHDGRGQGVQAAAQRRRRGVDRRGCL